MAAAHQIRLPGATAHLGFEGVTHEALAVVLGEAVRALDAGDVPHVLLGGMASAVHGRPRCSGDIDVLVRPIDAPRALDALREVGFATEETNPHWLFKAWKDGVLVDVLFKAKGDIYLDDAMLARSRLHRLMGHAVRVMPPEDLLAIKAIVHDEESPRHWHDALAILRTCDLDWDYLLARARCGPRRILSLLFYAESIDLEIPRHALATLCQRILERDGRSGDAG